MEHCRSKMRCVSGVTPRLHAKYPPKQFARFVQGGMRIGARAPASIMAIASLSIWEWSRVQSKHMEPVEAGWPGSKKAGSGP
jgi:hypothetical protein